ncbi:MAG: threonine--tRNA ligase, partial [Candidatus Adiutrix sp.]
MLKLNINGTDYDLQDGLSAIEALKQAKIPAKGPLKPLAARLNGQLIDLAAPIGESGQLESVNQSDPKALEILRHSVAHLMAEAVVLLFPEVKVTIGPAIENGFYYDFASPNPFTPDDLTRIEDKMREIIKKAEPFERSQMTTGEALDFFKAKGELFKVELIEDLIKQENITEVSLYKSGNFVDLCRGPHVPDASWGGAFKLLSVAGAYFRGDETRPMLQRIYGTAFFNKKELETHLHL